MDDIFKKEVEYTEYIRTHISNVQKAWQEIKPLLAESKFLITPEVSSKIDKNVIKHDASKFQSDEFQPYRQYFYPINLEEKIKIKKTIFSVFNLHYSRNPHHWEYYLDENKNPINRGNNRIPSLIEMVCDWRAMSYVFGGTPLTFYESKKNQIILLPDDRNYLEMVLHHLY